MLSQIPSQTHCLAYILKIKNLAHNCYYYLFFPERNKRLLFELYFTKVYNKNNFIFKKLLKIKNIIHTAPTFFNN